ncbi:Hsp70 family protein [Polymorphospora sp. NPDC051019]|uniref:Hsp70 family protein n=1 Tax=Polymorphospora sp. NPDC051019 TaxID=3155725 RepID=UPI00342E343F
MLVWPDGRSIPLIFDGSPALPSGVWVAPDGSVLTGEAAWRQASVAPDRFVPAPLRLPGDRAVATGGEVEAAALVAAVLGRVMGEAQRVAGGVVGEVVLVVPAGWGPRRRTWFRQVAHRAGIRQPSLVEAPVAVADHVLATGAQVLVGQFLLVCDFGAGFEATVLRRGPHGFEVLSTLHDEDAGGARVDELLAEQVRQAHPDLPKVSDPGGWAVVAGLRTARQALSGRSAVTVMLPEPAPAVVMTAQVVESVTTTVVRRAGELAREAMVAAEVDPAQVAGVYCVGGAALMPGAPQAIAQATGLSSLVPENPAVVAVYGAAGVGGAPTAPTYAATGGMARPSDFGGMTEGLLPSWWRAVAVVVPGMASLVVIAHFLFTAEVFNGARTFWGPSTYALANWGELAVASVLAMVACVAAGGVVASVLAAMNTVPGSVGVRVGAGIAGAAATGVSVAGLYAVAGSLWIGMPIGPLLRWAVLPVLPMVMLALVAAVLATWGGRQPVEGWDRWLGFPAVSVLVATAGMVLMQYAMTTPRPPDLALLIEVSARVGGLLVGVGIGWAVVSLWWQRLILVPLLAVFCTAIVSWQATGVLGVMYALAVAFWWLRKLWQLARSPARSVPHAR